MSYSNWLRSIVDCNDKSSATVLRFLSNFDALPYKGVEIVVQYAQHWCVLADFLYANREKQLSSDVEMLFSVNERNEKTDVYWFEVARACDQAATAASESIVQWMGILPVLTGKTGYAESGLSLTKEVLTKSMALVKDIVGLCHYTIVIANSHCKFLSAAPELMKSIKKRYHSFRVIGCWIMGMQVLQFSAIKDKEIDACSWFDTSSDLATTDKDQLINAVAPLIQSVALLKSYAYVVRSIANGEKGCATGFARQCSNYRQGNNAFIVRIEAMTTFPSGGFPLIVPKDDSLLLRIPTNPRKDPLIRGTSPLFTALKPSPVVTD